MPVQEHTTEIRRGDAGTAAATGTVLAQSFVRLRDGTVVSMREMRPSDEGALRTFLEGLDPESRQFRFFSGAVDLERMTHRMAAPGADRFSLLALDANHRVRAHAAYFVMSQGCAELGLEVADDLHGQGLGTVLVELLAQHAERQGIDRFVAQVLPANRAMLDVLRDGFAAHVTWNGGVNCVEFPTSAWRTASDRYPQPFALAGQDRELCAI